MPDFPGGMEYEVCEPFGAWCRQNFRCNPKDRRAEVQRLVDPFLSQSVRALDSSFFQPYMTALNRQ